MCAPAFALTLQSRDAQRVLFANLSAPRGVLITPGKIDPQVAKQLQTEWQEAHSGRGLGKTAVLSNGLTYVDIGFKAVDAQLLETILEHAAERLFDDVPRDERGRVERSLFLPPSAAGWPSLRNTGRYL